MKLCFSICSNNFLPAAKTMIDSIRVQQPGIKAMIFLVDRIDPTIDYSFISPSELIVVDGDIVPGFEEMMSRFTVIELNTAIRPFLYKYILSRFRDLSRVYYLDPDIYVYDNFDLLDRLLEDHDIVITPHFYEPISIDGTNPFETAGLRYGVYNAGFLAINPAGTEIHRFLDWWGERTSRFAYSDVSTGFFTDQIWLNLAPVFFNRVHILRHKGYNMAIWNLHERKIKNYLPDGKVELENGEPLVFYHFSKWDYFDPDVLSKGFYFFNFDNRPDLVPLFKEYYSRLNENGYDKFRDKACSLPVRELAKRSFLKRMLTPGMQFAKKIWHRI
jgi:hypothetical protein